MTESYKKLISTLEEIFQLDQADLDFGIYRIINQKRADITDFLQNKLLIQVNETLSQSAVGDTLELKKELENLEHTLQSAGIDPNTNQKVIELRKQYQSAGSPEALSNEVFSHLTSFFRRYYNQGDFISQRRYKNDVYAIPYEGEEVKLYWANYDQYYIKTSENFKNYTFKLDDGRMVSFNLREAETEQNNNQPLQGKDRFFKLATEAYLIFDNHHLSLWFTYESSEIKEKQVELNKAAHDVITRELPGEWKGSLLKHLPTKSNPTRTLLEKHLNDYTARNNFDYFIHKNLGAFLSRELDFYIKNEILHIDDINLDMPQAFDKQLKVVKALKTVAVKIIAMLAQLEDFQKKLWLKKKFVLQSDYCITLDRIPESFYPDIIANKEQIAEWKQLFAIDEIKADAITLPYAEPLTIDFLKANPFLLLDTKFFSRDWKYEVLSNMDNIDDQIDGLLINSDNYQALQLLNCKYNSNIKSIYIDPPYNSNASKILYKNDYEHSSWMSLMESRISLARNLLNIKGIIQIAIDDVEFHRLEALVRFVFGDENYLSNIAIMHNPKGRDQSYIAVSHEYTIMAAKNIREVVTNKLLLHEAQLNDKYKYTDDDGKKYRELPLRRSGSGAQREDRPYMFFPFIYDPQTNKLEVINIELYKKIFIGNMFNDDLIHQLEELYKKENKVLISPIRENGTKGRWRWGYDSCVKGVESNELFVKNNGESYTIYQKDPSEAYYLPKTFWYGERHDASTKGTNLLNSIIKNNPFDYPKSIYTVMDWITISSNSDDITLDFFAGSGTTGHAIINLNRIDDGTRKYILVEMGEYFNTVTKPRIQKVIYSEDWKDGKPVGRNGSSHCFKYLRLESYEDTLNNLQLKRSSAQQSLLTAESFGEEYLLHYMLDVESRESLLNTEMFKKPFGYTIKVTENNELKEQEVDLVETFNYLIGLVIDTMHIIRGNVVVQGKNLQGEKILVLWRDVEKTDNAALNEFFRTLSINTRDSEFKRIYVNGDNNLENLRTEDEQWKVVLIEEEFHKRMFEVKDI